MKVRVCILKADGTNCDQETSYAFTKAGGNCSIVTINQLRTKQIYLSEFDILVLPGGFSYGDDIASGKVLAIELISFLRDQLEEFVAAKKLIMGICNGFQVLVRTGLLPFRTLEKMQSTLLPNISGRFECRWVNISVERNPCIFTQSLIGQEIELPIAHGEGNFFANSNTIDELEKNNFVVLRYSQNKLQADFPGNPNGSLNSIAGICDKTGRILGLMPHPERFIEEYHYPDWRTKKVAPIGMQFFKNAVNFFG